MACQQAQTLFQPQLFTEKMECSGAPTRPCLSGTQNGVQWCTHTSLLIRNPISTLIKFLNLCHDRTNTSLHLGTMLTHSDVPVQYMSYTYGTGTSWRYSCAINELHLCHWNIIVIFQCNIWATLNAVLSFYLIFVTKGILLIVHLFMYFVQAIAVISVSDHLMH
jgi:hypothetical protein